jgi:hypothetical protein
MTANGFIATAASAPGQSLGASASPSGRSYGVRLGRFFGSRSALADVPLPDSPTFQTPETALWTCSCLHPS